MACEAFGAVQYGEARPQFGDELKLCLPLNLERVYLLFTFYNVAPKGKRTILGFAAIDLYGRNSAGAPMLLRNGLYHLPVVLALYEIPKGAARPLSAADCKKTKHTFSFRVRTLSSVFSQDVSIAALLYEDFSAIGQQQQQPLQQQQQPLHQGKNIGNGGNARQCLLLDSVSQRASAEELSRFFVPVMESLLDALYYCDLETSVHAFTAMLGVLRRLYELPLYQREGDTLLETYAEVLFDPSVYDTDNDGAAHRNITGLPLHDVLAQHWQNLAREGRLPGDTSANWLLQLLIAKAAQHYALRHGPTVSKTFEQNVCQAVRVLMSLYLTQAKMTPKNMKLLTKNIGSLADFVNAMMLVVDCSQLLSTVSVVLATMDGNNTDVRCASIVKVPFMRRFADYEHFVPLCCPVAFAPGAVESADTLEHALMHKYPPVGMLLREVSVSLAQRTHAYTVTFLLALLRKHDVDARYGAPAVRRRVATMYLPVVLDVLTQAETVGRADFGDELRHSLHLCVLWVLRDCDAVLVPVHMGNHWCLAVVNVRGRALEYYDSLGQRGADCLALLRRWLAADARAHGREVPDVAAWRDVEHSDIPVQQNGTDCGVFACKYAECVAAGRPCDFTQYDMNALRARMTYEILTGSLLPPPPPPSSSSLSSSSLSLPTPPPLS